MKRSITLLVALWITLSACGTLEISVDGTATPNLSPTATVGELQAQDAQSATQMPTLNPKTGLLTLDSSSETIRQIIQSSSTFWRSIFVDGTVTWFAPAGQSTPPQVYHEQDWIEPASHRFRVVLGPGGGAAESFKACDGISILEMDLKTGQSQSRSLPQFAKDPAATAGQDMLWGQIGTPLTEVILADNYAATGGTFVPVKLDTISERPTLVVDWTREAASDPAFRAWLDVETGVILKFQEFGKGGGTTMLGERLVNQVIYDSGFAETLFGSPASLPQFSDVNGQPLVSPESTPTSTSQGESLGEVYFFTFDSSHGIGTEIIRLNRLPGSCVSGQSACPQAEVVDTPFSLNFSLTPLVWSPDGKTAAFAVPGNESGDKTDLFIFDPAQEAWTCLVKFNVIDYPMWSEDGNWLAFREQDGVGGQDIYAIRRDGSGLINLTGSLKAPPENYPYNLDGWLKGKVMLHSGSPEAPGNVYLVDPQAGSPGLLSESLKLTSWAVPSPDGAAFVAIDYPGGNSRLILKLIDAWGNALQELMAFGDGYIGRVVWDSSSGQIAFSHTADSPDNQNVYVVKPDGTGMKQVYTGTSIAELAFSPDGRTLLVQAGDATGEHIFVVDLETLQQRLLQAPNLQLDWRWLAPSWQP